MLALLAFISIVLGAFAAWGQNDFKKLVAYSSVNHMGFVALGVASAALLAGAKATGTTPSITPADANLAASGAM